MADFYARLIAGANVVDWEDPPTANEPSRTNPEAYPHRAIRIAPSTAVTVAVIVDGAIYPLDTTLGGRTFYPKWAEWQAGPPPGAPPPVVSSPVGQSSSMSFTTPPYAGHYLLMVRRKLGGGFGIHFDVS